jgi:hypothetical protein
MGTLKEKTMSNNEQFKIGVSSHGKTQTTFGKLKWFYIKDNVDNIYRVLPPLFSLAESGKYAQWHAIHRGLRGTDGFQKSFVCPEETDRKTRLVTRRCPLCDKARELEAQVTLAKDKGASKDQLLKMRLELIMPVQSERKYYLNVVNQENQIGVLSISSRMFNSLRAECEDQDKKGIDLTGKDGQFMNFKKQTKYKGDKDAVHSAGVYFAQSPDGAYRPVVHSLTTEFIERLRTEATDLPHLFRSISDEEAEALASASATDRPLVLDRVFARQERDTSALESSQTTIPGTSAVAVNRLHITEAGVTSQSLGSIQSAKAPEPAPVVAPVVAAKTSISDEEFVKLFMPK